jgi:hypothetical protein
MTVSTTNNTVIYRGNGAVDEFSYPFLVYDEDHLVVQRRVFATQVIDKTYTSGEYTVDGVGEASGGSITLVAGALDDDYQIIITRELPIKQELDIVNQGGFLPDTLERQLDELTMSIQQVAAKANRAVVVAAGSTGFEVSEEDLDSVASLTFSNVGVGAQLRSIIEKLRESSLSITDFGASTSISGATQLAYLQAAINAAESTGRELFVPEGTFPYSGGALSIPDGVTIRGAGKLLSILQRTDAGAALVNTTAVTPRDITLRDLQIVGGTVGLDISGSNVSTEITVEDCLFLNQTTAGIRCNKMMITWYIRRNIFDSCTVGIQVLAANTTNTVIEENQFKELGGRSIDIRGGIEAVSIKRNRFEARNLPLTDTGVSVIYLELGQAVEITNNYFEDTFRTIIEEVSSINGIKFEANRCSGQENTVGGTGPKTELFISDGIIEFSGNDFFAGSLGSEQMKLGRFNRGLDTSAAWIWRAFEDRHIDVTVPNKTVTAEDSVYQLFTFNRASVSGKDLRAFHGLLTVTYIGHTTDDEPWRSTVIYSVVVGGFAGGNLAITSELINQIDGTVVIPAVTVESVGASSTEVTLRVRMAGIDDDGVATGLFEVGRFTASLVGDLVTHETWDPITVEAVL